MATLRQIQASINQRIVRISNEMGPDYGLSLRAFCGSCNRYQMLLHVDGNKYPISGKLNATEMTHWINAFSAPLEVIALEYPEQINDRLQQSQNLLKMIACKNLEYHGFFSYRSGSSKVLCVVVD